MVIDKIRVQKKVKYKDELPEFEIENETSSIYEDLIPRVMSIIQVLPVGQKQVFLMKVFSKNTTREIAEKLNRSPQTILNQYTNAVNNIRKSLKLLNI